MSDSEHNLAPAQVQHIPCKATKEAPPNRSDMDVTETLVMSKPGRPQFGWRNVEVTRCGRMYAWMCWEEAFAFYGKNQAVLSAMLQGAQAICWESGAVAVTMYHVQVGLVPGELGVPDVAVASGGNGLASNVTG